MSRHAIYNSEKNLQLNYGWDHALGYFYDIVDMTQDEDSEKFILEEKSSAMDDMSRKEFHQILEEWDAPREHVLAVALDQKF
jgi:hypothetical protein